MAMPSASAAAPPKRPKPQAQTNMEPPRVRGAQPSWQAIRLQQLEAVLRRFDVHQVKAQDLVVLDEYEIVVIADDSGSMCKPAGPSGQPVSSRWEELKETLALIVDLGCCFDQSGIDIYFLNRDKVSNVTSSADIVSIFREPPYGTTPLTETLRSVRQEHEDGRKDVLLFILTDGKPDGGVDVFQQEVLDLVKVRKRGINFKVQIMACTNEENSIKWLNKLDGKSKHIDVTDDYWTERTQILGLERTRAFSHGDWCAKAMLGPLHDHYDAQDEYESDDDERCQCSCM